MLNNKALRNAQIELKNREGKTIPALAKEFQISTTRVRHIIAAQKRCLRQIERRLNAPLRHVT